jgi:formate hydrogenlyase subunit 3/multisubunit Na+/H+ antiporter MnhD subunit
MVAGLLHPLNIFILGLGGGFLIPLLNRLGRAWVAVVFVLALTGMVLISGVSLFAFLNGDPPIEIYTGGASPPYAINLRLGLAESVFTFSVCVVALLGAFYFVRERYGVMLLYLIIVTGIQGMVMTRDLFNLFVFLEIVSIATYGLLSLRDTPAALSATFKYLMATVLASAFFLLGTMLLYAATGILNIDDLLERSESIAGPIAFAALMFVLACLLVELKPFPANGWGLDVYETAHSAVSALISVGVSAGVFFALLKLLPLYEGQLGVIAFSGAVTFLFSNLIGLQQTKVQRLLGYSSIGQMGLLTVALALLHQLDADTVIPLVVGGLFVNHLLAKAGLFWLAGFVGRERLDDFAALAGRPLLIFVFAILLAAISGFPPFPGFWAKWHLVFTLAEGERYAWIAIVLAGSLLEAAYLFRWFGRIVHAAVEPADMRHSPAELLPVFGAALLLVVSGYFSAILAGLSARWVFVPLAAGLALYLLDGLPGRVKGMLVIAVLLVGGLWLIRDLTGINYLFAALLYAGGLVLSIACLYRSDARPGFHALLAVMLLSLPALPRAATSLEFFFVWELITLSSYFLILRGRAAGPHALRYLLFSLVAAFFLLVGFAAAAAANGTISLAALRMAGPESNAAFVLLAIGLLIKAGAIGVHVWLPGAYAEADDDVSAMLSAVVGKVSMFGLLVGTYVAIRSEVSLNLAHVLGWIGMLTTLAGAMLAVRQDDIKRMLAYSSMSQLGYIVTAIALTSHLGWVTALYLVANHMMVKGILFLAAAAIILRTGMRMLADLGGLAGRMPLTFALAALAIVAMSGLPPLAGFGGKWLLLSAMMEKGWYGPVMLGVLATFVGFLYMWRFIQVVFLGARKAAHDRVADAPLALIAPQLLLCAGILVMSFYPKLLIEPVSKAIDPYFASTLVWEGMSLEMIYGYWNPVPVMTFAVTASVILFGVFWLVRRGGLIERHRMRSDALGAREAGGFYAYYKPFFAMLTPPAARAFWDGLTAGTMTLAGRTRLIYTGDGQTYNLYILYYFIVLYVACGGLGHLWPRG